MTGKTALHILAILSAAFPAELLAQTAGIVDVTAMVNQAETLAQQGKNDEAEKLLARARDLLSAARPESEDLVYVTNDLAAVYESEGKNREAEQLLLDALAIQHRLAAPTVRLTVELTANLATAHFGLGDWDKAEREYREARVAAVKAGLEESVADMSLRLGMLYRAQGQFAKAGPEYMRARDIQKRIAGETYQYALTLNELASLYHDEGDMSSAAELAPQALRLLQNTLGETNPYTLRCRHFIAVFYFDTGQYEKAEETLRETVAIREKLLPPPLVEMSDDLDTLGSLLMKKKSEPYYAESERLLLRSLVMRAKMLGPNHADTAATLLHLADLYHLERQYERAEPYYVAARSIYEKSNPGHLYAITLLAKHARNLWQLGRRHEACGQLIAENRALTDLWSRNLLAMDAVRRRSFVREFDELLPLSLSIASELPGEDGANLAAVALGARKGIRSSATQELFAQVRRDRDPESDVLLRDLAANAQKQAREIRQPIPGLSMAKLRQDERELEQKLIARSKGYRTWREPVDPESVASHLPAGSVFLDIIRFSKFDLAADESMDRDSSGNPVEKNAHYAAVVYRVGVMPALVVLGPAQPIDGAIFNLQRNFANIWEGQTLIRGEKFNSNLTHTNEDCAAIYRLSMAKLFDALGVAKRLIISPDAKLAEIPWEILRTDNGRYLIEEGYRVSYLDSVRSLVYPPAETEPRSEAVVIANVDYNDRTAETENVKEGRMGEDEERPEGVPGQPGNGGWKPLNGGTEILAALRELGPRLGPVKKLARGSEEEVLALRQPAALIAHTHGFFHANLKDVGEGLDAGIILYGANFASAGRKRRDGWLMAKEVMLLNLQGTRLVALLGCDTGLGIEAGEGVQGLRHAIAVAGARASLLTLWEVGDISTARLMKELLIRSASADAKPLEVILIETKLAFARGEIRESGSTASSNRWRHPYFWAAPTLAGSIRKLDFRIVEP